MKEPAHRRARRMPDLLIVLALLAGLLAAFPGGAGAASYVVTNCNDSGPGSLRDAIYSANGNANAPHTITFNLSPACDTITLTTGELVLLQDMTIQGPESTTLAVSGNGVFRVFNVYPGVTATISGLTIRDGAALTSGGGVLNQGSLTIVNSGITGNTAGQRGGGVHSEGPLTIINSSIRFNSAEQGGGVSSDGPLTITRSAIADNRAELIGGGVFVTATASFTDVLIQANIAPTGGGVANFGTLSIAAATIDGNTAENSGGGLYGYGTTHITTSRISGNTAEFGAGVANPGVMTITRSTLNGNSAQSGGGVMNTGSVHITNSTIFGNTAANLGGGVRSTDVGDNRITSSTIAANSSGTGGGLHIENAMMLLSTIVAGNTAVSSSPDAHGPIVDGYYNLLGRNTGNSGLVNGVNGNIVGDDANPAIPVLDSLKDNGGGTATSKLLPGSPAINHIPASACAATTDQRGLSRPQGSGCDIGAYEEFEHTSYQACLYAGTLSQVRPAELMQQPPSCGRGTAIVLVSGGDPSEFSYQACLYAGSLSRVGYEPVADCGRGTNAAFAVGSDLWACLHAGALSQVNTSQPNCARGTRIGLALP